jgi:hypothetical protein
MVCQANKKVLHIKKKRGGSLCLSQFVSEISSVFCILIEIQGKVCKSNSTVDSRNL